MNNCPPLMNFVVFNWFLCSCFIAFVLWYFKLISPSHSKCANCTENAMWVYLNGSRQNGKPELLNSLVQSENVPRMLDWQLTPENCTEPIAKDCKVDEKHSRNAIAETIQMPLHFAQYMLTKTRNIASYSLDLFVFTPWQMASDVIHHGKNWALSVHEPMETCE